ncbi:M20/M25/M40 family metallo-hydrolase [Brevibacterium sp. UMB1308A]|uniref:M20/M25/M40 family metallo-hydrolase n=1 Tax=Brevibacterium sp. UMB1308A TaxID=3050608 RepID=UPI00254BCE2D|nr:M20/M25/M40 family metallo-hydrolase [Brevibacterium sp. UMB1308A]MDK8346015.1 M20/M25/M40 family metallo-hydrolase [Brevibacterium sp. UMB1308B]MDK8713018.1 M20/M25/M40 family metallo-hydrolase [Brevibacterium sp. UMB1308A]
MKRFLYGAGASVAALALGASVASPALAAPETHFNTMGVTGEDAMAYLKDISDITLKHKDEEFRALGTKGYEEASEYVEKVLTDLGYEVERQEFTVPSQKFGKIELTVDGENVKAKSLSYTEGTKDPITDAALVLPVDDKYGDSAGGELGCSTDDFDETVKDAIVLVQRGECAFSDKVKNASEKGAAGVVIYNNTEGDLNGTLGERFEGSAPAVSVDQATGDSLRDKVTAEDADVKASLTLETEFTESKTWNILAETKAGDPNNVHMLGAHLDSVPEGPGINDNASGVAGVLTVAKGLANQEREVDNKVRIGIWGAEEVGLVGSTHYVESLSEEELGKITSYLNYDMIGSNNYAVSTLDANGDYRDIPEGVTVPEGSVELEQLYTDYFDSVDQPYIGAAFSGRSDYQAFMDAGIPVGGVNSGADEVKTEEEAKLFGGEVGKQLDTNYHKITDTLENVNVDSVNAIVPSMANATYQLAYTDEHKAEDAQKPEEEAPEEEAPEEEAPEKEAPGEDKPKEEDPKGEKPESDAKDDSGDAKEDDAKAGDANLPRTGSEMMPWVAGAAVLVAVGSATVVLTRRKRQ